MILYITLFLLICILLIFLVDIKLRDFIGKEEKINTHEKVKDIRRDQLIKKKKGFFDRLKDDTQQVLKESNMNITYKKFIRNAIILGLIGFVIGLITKNPFLPLILGVGFTYAPIQYLKVLLTKRNKKSLINLHTTASSVTNSFMESDNIKSAVAENLDRMVEPYLSIFKKFYYQSMYINPNLEDTLSSLREAIDNDDWYNWCSVLIDCVDDIQNKHSLPSIIGRMADKKALQRDADSVIDDSVMMYFSIVLVSALFIPLLAFMLTDIFNSMMSEFIGKLIMAIYVLVTFCNTVYVLHVANKPMDKL